MLFILFLFCICIIVYRSCNLCEMFSENLKLFIIFIVFIIGAYVTSSHTFYSKKGGLEGFEGDASGNEQDKEVNPLKKRCPNLLIQKGTTLYLYNTNLAPVPGVNPIRFDNLEQYIEFIDWLRGQGIRCPILFLQHTLNAQGESVYNIRPSPTDLNGGLCPTTAHVSEINANPDDNPENYDDGMGPGNGQGAFRLHSINAKAGAASSRYDSIVSPQQISEITKLIDQEGNNDPYSISMYPNVFNSSADSKIIRPADRESMLKIQASYLRN